MFSLAMLVRLGKVTEQDLRATFAAFRRLDVNNEGILNSKSIIAAMIQKRRAVARPIGTPVTPVTPLFMAPPQPPPPTGPYWVGANNLYYGGGLENFPSSYHYSPISRRPRSQEGFTMTSEESSLVHGGTHNKSYVMSGHDSPRSF
jgi:hypothetical protein